MKRLYKLIDGMFGGSPMPSSSRTAKIKSAIAAREAEIAELLTYEPTPERVAIVSRMRSALAELKAKIAEREAWENATASFQIPTNNQVRAVVCEACFVAPKAIAEKITDLQRAFELDMAGVAAHIPSKAREAFAEHGEKLNALILAGESVVGHEGWTLEDYEEEFRQKSGAYKEAAKRHSVEAFAVIEPILGDVDEAIEEYALQKEMNERSLAEVFMLEFKPSQVLLLVRKAQCVIRNYQTTFSPHSGIAPRDIAPFI